MQCRWCCLPLGLSLKYVYTVFEFVSTLVFIHGGGFLLVGQVVPFFGSCLNVGNFLPKPSTSIYLSPYLSWFLSLNLFTHKKYLSLFKIYLHLSHVSVQIKNQHLEQLCHMTLASENGVVLIIWHEFSVQLFSAVLCVMFCRTPTVVVGGRGGEGYKPVGETLRCSQLLLLVVPPY